VLHVPSVAFFVIQSFYRYQAMSDDDDDDDDDDPSSAMRIETC
jgi:hypothetical protein